MSRPPPKPLIGVTACRRLIGERPFHAVGERYLRAAAVGADAMVLVIPALGGELAPEDLVERLDGLLITGSPSNVEPHHYGAGTESAAPPHDPDRDATTLPLIRAAIAAGLPLLGICRGLQEVNVALGGTLHPRLTEVEGLANHREDEDASLERQYGPAHTVRLVAGGRLAALAGQLEGGEVTVNSLHGQGIARLGAGLTVEAVAPDGLVEAIRVTDAAALALAVQWHPEWLFAEDRLSRALFATLGDGARERAARRTGRIHP